MKTFEELKTSYEQTIARWEELENKEELTDEERTELEGLPEKAEETAKQMKRAAALEKAKEEKRKLFSLVRPDPSSGEGASNVINNVDPMSRGYSLRRLARAIAEKDWSLAKQERDWSEKLEAEGYRKVGGGVLLPAFCTELENLHENLRKAGLSEAMRIQEDVDPEEMTRILLKRALARGEVRADLQVGSDLYGGALRPFTVGGDFIEMLRNRVVVQLAGARDFILPPSGQLKLNKQKSGVTFYWIGEGGTFTESDLTVGDLNFVAKKMGGYVVATNESLKFTSGALEAILRQDLVNGSARFQDLAFLEAVGSSNQPKGIINHGGIITHVASTVDTDGNTFEPEDVGLMMGKVEDANGEFMSWIMRSLLYRALGNRRADAVSAGDGKGDFLFDVPRGQFSGPGVRDTLSGRPVYPTAQVSNTRAKGSGTDLTYVLGGDFSQVLIGRVGTMELASSGSAKDAFEKDETHFRVISHVDQGIRHEGVLIFCDTLING